MHESLINLVDTLAKKNNKNSVEARTYLQGILYMEKFFELNSFMLGRELDGLKERNDVDTSESVGKDT